MLAMYCIRHAKQCIGEDYGKSRGSDDRERVDDERLFIGLCTGVHGVNGIKRLRYERLFIA